MGLSRDATIRTLTRQLKEALALVNAQAEQIKALTERITQLENELAKAKKDSSNSSKPSSSDIVNPKKAAKKKRKRKRKPGGQKGHPKHERPDFPPESIDETWEYFLKSCPLCGGGLEDASRAPRVVQQVEIIDVPIRKTGHKENGKRFWTWCFRAEMYTLFRIDKSRGSKVLIDVLGEEFDGVIGCDFWGAYKKYMRLHENVLLQFCMAHLIRDVKYLTTLSGKATKAYGERLREALREMFRVIHRREEVLPRTFERRLSAARDRVFFTATENVPSSNWPSLLFDSG